MAEHRSGCPINLATEVLGDKWSLVILRAMMFGDRRYFRELLHNSHLPPLMTAVPPDHLPAR
jgi:DNA-binding HxlR family transcriptional regulator